MIKTLGEHTVDVSLIKGGAWAIDVGCRGFTFSEAMRDLGLFVRAYDVEEMESPQGIDFYKEAVLNKEGYVKIKFTDDKQAVHVSDEGEIVKCIDINSIYSQIINIDVLKLDCEGSEYHILSDPNFQPIPKQISIEFHAHCFPELHDRLYPKCLENLLKYYTPVQHEWTTQHGAGFNYWDSLFLRNDLIK